MHSARAAACAMPQTSIPEPEPPDTSAFTSYDDARAWVHLSAAQAGFRSIAWDADSCAAPEACTAG